MTAGDHGFRRSSTCSGGSCVEVAPRADGWVALRDSKDARKPEHLFTAEEWADFVAGVKAGEFDFAAPRGVESDTVRLSL